jgi:dipeptidase D
MSILKNLEPALLWKYFDALRKIPRPSGDETAAAEYVVSVAQQLGLEYSKDATGNVIIRKPGSPGHENAKPIVLQSHLDMVCEKNSDKVFDFSKDAIQLVRKDDWLTADGTTLGADNGIGVAATLALFEDKTLVNGPLEAVFTVDEERGLVGARTVSSAALQGRTMINLDSEDLGVFSIGCAGGRDSDLTLPVQRRTAKGDAVLELGLSGLRGGHSGIDINQGRGNALKIMNRLLFQAHRSLPIEVVFLNGGDKHNAIPREAFAKLVIPSQNVNDLKAWFNKAFKEIQVEFSPIEQDIRLTIVELKEATPQVLTDHSQKVFSALLFALPHGVLAMSRVIDKLVETSNNVAAVHCADHEIQILCSSRSSNGPALQATVDKLYAIAELAGAKADQPPGYPGWMPDLKSNVLKVALDTFKQVAGREAKYEAIHAGLECGIIGERFPGMDMISMGPTIKHPHSPDECVDVGTVDIFYRHVVNMLEVLA